MPDIGDISIKIEKRVIVMLDILRNFMLLILPEYEKYLMNDKTIEPNSRRIRKDSIEEIRQYLKEANK